MAVIGGGGWVEEGLACKVHKGFPLVYFYYVFPSLAKIKMWKKKDQEYYYKTLLFYWNIFNWIII